MKNKDYSRFIGEEFSISEFTIGKSGSRSDIDPADDAYTLKILPGNPSNKLCPDFKAVLIQELVVDDMSPAIMYPPESGDTNHLLSRLEGSEPYFEVASMDQMMRQSILQGGTCTLTPAAAFGLKNKPEDQCVMKNNDCNIGDIVEVNYFKTTAYNGIQFRVTEGIPHGWKGIVTKSTSGQEKCFPVGGAFAWAASTGLVVIKHEASENQVYIDHMYERLTQQLTQQEVLALAARLKSFARELNG